MDQAREPVAAGAAKPAAGKGARKDLWTRIVERAKKDKISYREATEICVKEYWTDCGLTKKP